MGVTFFDSGRGKAAVRFAFNEMHYLNDMQLLLKVNGQARQLVAGETGYPVVPAGI